MVKRPPAFRPPTFGKRYDEPGNERLSAAKRGYGRSWRALRAAFLSDNPLCVCGAPATEVDHVISLRRGGSNHHSNLQALCKPCHARKTVEIDGGFGNPKNRSELGRRRPPPSPLSISTKSMFGQGVSRDGKE